MNLGTNAKAGQGEYVIAEADESDGSFLQYHPWLGLLPILKQIISRIITVILKA